MRKYEERLKLCIRLFIGGRGKIYGFHQQVFLTKYYLMVYVMLLLYLLSICKSSENMRIQSNNVDEGCVFSLH